MGVFGQIYDKNNVSIGSEFRINTFTTNKQTMTKLASYQDGKFIATYSSEGNDGDMFGVFGQIFNADGTRDGSEFQINTNTSNSQYSSDISILDNGNALVTWASYHLHSSTGKEHEIFGQVIDSNGNTVGGEFQINTTVIGGQGQPSISKLSNGNLIVAWESAEVAHGTTFDIKAQILNSSGTKIGEEFLLNSTTSNDQSEPILVGLKKGGFVSVWQSNGQDGDGNGIYARIFDNNGIATTSEFRINTITSNEQIIPRLTGTNDGGFTVTWSSNLQDGSDYGVFARKFNSKGEAMSEEFQLNTTTSGLQKYADIITLENGDMMSTWISDGQDGDGYGIFAKRFSWNPINLIDTAINNLSKIMLPLGTLKNRLNSIINNITDVDLKLSKSISNIKDANFALETSKLARNQILQQASISMVTQASNASKHLLQIINKE